MRSILSHSWALLFGIFLLMVGNGIQGTLLGIRGEIEAFSTTQMSYVMSAYFLGFLGGSSAAPVMIRRVGHVRVFAALGSAISAVLILYPVLVDPIAWGLGRVVIGFCFSGVYVTAESWLNNAVDNANRGKALSFYVIVQMAGIVTAQGLMSIGDASGFILFIVPSVFVSLAFAPILLSVQPTPAFATSKPFPLRKLVETSPLTSVGTFILGGVYSIQIAMSAVYAAQIGFSVGQIATLVSAIYTGALLAQFPIGWLSDKMDRRVLVVILAVVGGIGALMPFVSDSYVVVLVAAAVTGATANPLYALLIAYANDYLEHDDMASASAGYVFINGVGAISGPILAGWLMTEFGPSAYWAQMSVLMLALAIYATYRMTQRAAIDPQDTVPYAPFTQSASVVTVEVAQEEYIAREIEEAEAEVTP